MLAFALVRLSCKPEMRSLPASLRHVTWLPWLHFQEYVRAGHTQQGAEIEPPTSAPMCFFGLRSSSGHRPNASGIRSVLRKDHPTSRGSNHDCRSDSYGGRGDIRSSDGSVHRPTSRDHHSHISAPPPELWWPERSQSLLPVRFFSSYISMPYGRGMAPKGRLEQKTNGAAACSLGAIGSQHNRKRTEQSPSLRQPGAC